MKKKNYKTFLILGLVLFLSVGYAVVNSVTLTITGSTSAMTSSVKTEFTQNMYISNSSKASVNFLNSKTAQVTINDMKLNERIELELEVINNEQDVFVKYLVTDFVTTDINNEYYRITPDFGIGITGTSQSYEPLDEYIAAPGQKVTGKLTVELIKTPITEEDSKIEFTITTTATPYQE